MEKEEDSSANHLSGSDSFLDLRVTSDILDDRLSSFKGIRKRPSVSGPSRADIGTIAAPMAFLAMERAVPAVSHFRTILDRMPLALKKF